MGSPLLDRVASVWRTTPNLADPSGYTTTQVYSAVKCAIIPVSQADAQISYSLQATHLVWVEHWLVLHKEDEVRYGRRLPDAFGDDVTPYVFVINGRRQFTPGVPQTAYWATERE